MKQKEKKIATIIAIAIIGIMALTYFSAAQAQDQLNFVVTLYYDDGTTGTFDSRSTNLPTATIVDSTGKTVTSMNVELYATTSYTGTVQSWSTAGTLSWSILSSSGSVLTTVQMPLSSSGSGAPPNNQPFVLAGSTSSASAIESMYSGLINGQNYILRFSASTISVTLNFADGPQTKTASRSLDWAFTYMDANTFNSLSITWNPTTY